MIEKYYIEECTCEWEGPPMPEMYTYINKYILNNHILYYTLNNKNYSNIFKTTNYTNLINQVHFLSFLTLKKDVLFKKISINFDFNITHNITFDYPEDYKLNLAVAWHGSNAIKSLLSIPILVDSGKKFTYKKELENVYLIKNSCIFLITYPIIITSFSTSFKDVSLTEAPIQQSFIEFEY